MASSKSLDTPKTSPVDFISGPKLISAPVIFSNEKTGILIATVSFSLANPYSYPCSLIVFPIMTCVATSTTGISVTLEI